jgi:hypothetical protein
VNAKKQAVVPSSCGEGGEKSGENRFFKRAQRTLAKSLIYLGFKKLPLYVAI